MAAMREPSPFGISLAILAALIVSTAIGTIVNDDIAQADINNSQNTLLANHIVRNIVVGRSVAVCTSDYPIATNDAVAMWNDNLRGASGFLMDDENRGPFTDTDLFNYSEARCPEHTGLTSLDYVHHIQVDARDPDEDDFYCSGLRAVGCILMPLRSNEPLYTFAGDMFIIVNSDRRDTDDDDNGNTDLAYQRIRRTIAHELGHALGFSHPLGGTQATGCTSPAALMAQTICGAHYPLQEEDFTRYALAYRPNVVAARGTTAIVEHLTEQPGTVVFNFDASDVNVEQEIEIRRWNGTAWEDQAIQSFDADTEEVTWVIANQPAGMQRYGIFSTTQAYIDGQCFINDSDCDGMDVDNIPITTGTRIGFGRIEVVEVTAALTPIPNRFALNVSVEGGGAVTRSQDGPVYDAGIDVTLTAVEASGTGSVGTSVRETATLTRFAGWGGDAAVCRTTNPCDIRISRDMEVTARFEPRESELTIEVVDGDGTGDAVVLPRDGVVLPNQGNHTYDAGTTVRAHAGWDATMHVVRWSGCNFRLSSGRWCDVYMSRNKTVTLFIEENTVPRFSASSVTHTFTVGSAVNVLLPAATTGNGPLSYTLDEDSLSLPSGLRFIRSKRAISGTPIAATAQQTYTLTVKDEDSNGETDDEHTLSVHIIVNEAPEVTISAGSSPVTEGTAATFTVTRTGATTSSLSVTVSVTESGAMISGTAPPQ